MEARQSKPGFYARWSWALLLVLGSLVPFAFYGAGQAVQSNVNKIEDWLPKSFRETGELGWFRQHFPTDQFILLTWEGCKLAGDPEIFPLQEDDPRIALVAEALRGDDPTGQDEDAALCRRYFKSVTTGRMLLDQLISNPQSLPHAEAVERLQGSLLGPDGRQTCLLLGLTEDATRELKKVLGRGQYRIFRPSVPPGVLRRQLTKCGINDQILRLGGPPVDNISIDEEGEKTLARLAGISGLLGIFLAWWSLRHIGMTMIVFFCAVLSAALSLAAIYYSGQTVDAIVLSMPSLVYVLAISGAVHLINYYRDAVIEGGLEGAAERGAWHAFKPAALCTTTTALGLISLYASELTPIRKFGLYAAIGVILTQGVIFHLIPSALELWKIGRIWLHIRPDEDAEPDPESVLDTSKMTPFAKFWNTFGSLMIRNHAAVFAGGVALICLIGLGLGRAKTSINLLELFDSQARILKDYRWIENRLGMLVPLEIVVRFSPESQAQGERTNDSTTEDLFRLTFLERLETTALIQETIEKEFGQTGQGIVGRSISAATFAPSMPAQNGGLISFANRAAYNSRLEESREEFIKSGYLRTDPTDGSELWRVSLRVAAFQGVDYGQFVHELRATIQPIMEAHRYRVEILSHMANGSEDKHISVRKVFLWDSPDPAGYEEGTLAREATMRIDQHHAMIDALDSLLTKARLRVSRSQKNPSEIPHTKMQLLNQLDQVILVGDFTKDQLEDIRFALPSAIYVAPPTPPKKQMVAEASSEDQPWLSAVYTGVVPIVYKAQRALLESLIESTFWSFATITPLMMLVSRSLRAGMVAMIPNLLPVVAIFGAMGWLGIAIDIGSMMTASIALGVAVDDTIHFLSWFRGDLDKLKDRHKAILAAYQRCAIPTLQAAVISGLGLSVFAFSTFTPTQRFGWLMLTILIAGVVAELVLLPAILAGPLGRVFDRHSRRTSLGKLWLLARYQGRKWTEPKSEVSLRRVA
ncbi:MAG: efflux RND transporter permease subunit [Pirellulaceae bacterium]